MPPKPDPKAAARAEPFIAGSPVAGMRRCAILQFEARHEETIPSLIAAANAAGYFPHVFLHNRCKRRRGDIFAETTAFQAEVTYCGFGSDDGEGEGAEEKIRATLARVYEDDIDFVVMNSFNRTRGCAWALSLAKPVIAVVHNVDHFLGEDHSKPAVAKRNFQFVTLGPHVAAELIARMGKDQMDRIDVIEPCVWGAGDPVPKGGQPRRISIPGAVSLRTRDYGGLLDLIAARKGALEGLRFVLGSGGKDRERIEAEAKSRGLAPWFEFLPLTGEQVSHSDYFASLRGAQAILPLMPQDFDQYQRIKITSAISASVGFAVPIVLDRWSRACYRLPSLIADHSLAAQVDLLAHVPEAELQTLRADLVAYRRSAMAENGAAFARLAARARGMA